MNAGQGPANGSWNQEVGSQLQRGGKPEEFHYNGVMQAGEKKYWPVTEDERPSDEMSGGFFLFNLVC